MLKSQETVGVFCEAIYFFKKIFLVCKARIVKKKFFSKNEAIEATRCSISPLKLINAHQAFYSLFIV